MKYCPYCGEELLDEKVLFCSECGKPIPERKIKEEAHVDCSNEQPTTENPVAIEQPEETTDNDPTEFNDTNEVKFKDCYDGYYDDVFPDDHGNIRTVVDKQLIKKIIVLGVSVVLIIAACVAIMYIL